MDSSIPKENIDENDSPKLRTQKDLFQMSNLESTMRNMATTLKSSLSNLNILVVEDPTVRLVDGARKEKVAEYANGKGNQGTDDVHPSPAG